MKLSELSIGSTATILRVGGAGALRQHFLDMGLIQGTEVTVVKYAPMGDPVELRIHGYELTIRLADAENIETSEPHKPKTSKKKVAKPEKHHPGYGEGGKFHDRNHENPLSDSETLTFALVGNQNCGKTTLFNVLSGIIPPDEGKVYLKDQDVTSTPGSISYMLQKDLLLPHKKVIDNVALPLVLKGVKKAEAREKANPLFAEFGLEGTQYQYPSQLSGGMRQRAALLRTYLSSSGVALLDEPFSALDTLTKASVHKWYLEVMQHIDLSTLFITHDIDEAILLSDRIYILNGTPGTIKDEIVIQERKPRAEDFALSEEFLEYKRQIISKL